MRYAEVPNFNAAPTPAAQPSTTTKHKNPLASPFTTYTAYGMTEIMYKECGSQAEYFMPELVDDAENAQTEEGEDLGVGDTWWHTGKCT